MHSLHATFRRRASASGRCAKVKAPDHPDGTAEPDSPRRLPGPGSTTAGRSACRSRRPRRSSPISRLPLGKAHQRDKLAALLWGDMREPQARAGLRQALFALRRALDDQGVLRIEGETIALDPDARRTRRRGLSISCVTLAQPG